MLNGPMSHSGFPADSLSAMALHTLAIAMRRFGALPFQEEQLLRAGRADYSGAEYRIAFLELRHAGLITAVRKGWGEKLYSISPVTYFYWHPILFPGLPLPVEDNGIVYTGDHPEPSPPLGLQLLHAIAELVRTGMKLTAKGMLTKRTVEKSTRHLFLREEAADFLSFPHNAAGYPFPIAVMLDMAARMNLLLVQDSQLALNEHAFRQWLERPALHREAELIRMWIEVYAARTSRSADAAALMSRLEPSSWYRLDDLDLLLECHAYGMQDGVPSQTPARAWCGIMVSLGWMEEASTIDGGRACRWLYRCALSEPADVQPMATESIRITPNSDIYVPPLAATRDRWQLEMVAERVQCDVMTVYRLSAKSISEACGRGIQCKDIVCFLETSSGEPLPETVQYAIDGWGQGATASHTSSSLSPHAGDGRTLDPLFSDPTQISHLDQSNEMPTAESLFQGLNEVPLVWRSQMRVYHPSTRRELLERALNWRIPVNLTVSGSVVRFIPEGLEEGNGEWAVTGRVRPHSGTETEPVKLSPDMWDEMMLVIPKLRLH
ncbi:helicase-associated domain-containing protein [Paenibacillus spongiae]|uniref:Helicase-associated domain-containing protein n=1 Tax=Paenibacillus spongiae TaxID=2909671 RepID=A0ABY5S1U8_9BACL|nr:helicase-associated domain-containing protein [Paenibacillus spongiae]UVI27851.1 helicase-associated domain-containing protein [Paenibacillus spongiae]